METPHGRRECFVPTVEGILVVVISVSGDEEGGPDGEAEGAHITVSRLFPPGRANRDKGPAEAGVLLVERWILARLRHE